jgi:hypothetical protein
MNDLELYTRTWGATAVRLDCGLAPALRLNDPNHRIHAKERQFPQKKKKLRAAGIDLSGLWRISTLSEEVFCLSSSDGQSRTRRSHRTADQQWPPIKPLVEP